MSARGSLATERAAISAITRPSPNIGIGHDDRGAPPRRVRVFLVDHALFLSRVRAEVGDRFEVDVLDAFAGGSKPWIDPALDQLTPREREVLRYIARGYAYKQIGRQLHISPKTVETHVSAVLRKLQLSNRYELSRWATDRRLA